jgi:hypothetical protein
MKVIIPVAIPAVFSTFARASKAWTFNSSKVLTEHAIDAIRGNWNPETGVYEGVTIEPARTNLVENSDTPVTQSCVVSPTNYYVLSFWGSGSVTVNTLTGSQTIDGGAGTIYPNYRRVEVVRAGTSPMLLTLSGSVNHLQLEMGNKVTSYIPTVGAGVTVTRAADVVSVGQYYTTFVDATAAYDAGTTYAKGNVVQYNARKYSSTIDANTGSTPGSLDANWTDIGATNVWAMHDRVSGGQAIASSPYAYFSFRAPSDVDAVALVNIEAKSVTVVVSDGYGTVESQTKTGDLTAVAFTGFTPGAYVTIALDNWPDVPKVGECIAGTLFEAGETEFPLDITLVDYSRKETDPDFGTTTFVELDYASIIDATVEVAKVRHGLVAKTLNRLRATPTAYIFSDDTDYGEDVIHYAYIMSFRRSIARPTLSILSIELGSLV